MAEELGKLSDKSIIHITKGYMNKYVNYPNNALPPSVKQNAAFRVKRIRGRKFLKLNTKTVFNKINMI